MAEPDEPKALELSAVANDVINASDRDVRIAQIRARIGAAVEGLVSLRTGQSTDEIMRDIRGEEPCP